jgi:hypothetical protein
MQKRFGLISMILLLLFGLAEGQEKETSGLEDFQGVTIDFGSGLYKTKLRDELYSPLIYQGFSPVFPQNEIRLRSQKFQFFSETELGYGMSLSGIKSDWMPSPGLQLPFYTDFGILYKTKYWNAQNRYLWLGLNIHFNGNFITQSKLGNSSFDYYTSLGSGLIGRLELPFGWKAKDYHIFKKITIHRRQRKLLFAWQIEYPLAGVIVRPSFDGIFYPLFANPDKSLILDDENIDFYFLKAVYVRSHLELSYLLYNRNRLKLSYNWNYFHYSKYEIPVTSINYGFLFSYVFAF